MTVWVYFLLCDGDVLYTGVAEDPNARFEKHVAGTGARFTRMRKPIALLGALPFDTRSEALSKEYAFKQLSRQQKLQLAEHASRHPMWLEVSARYRSC
jgi:putative endonuclease